MTLPRKIALGAAAGLVLGALSELTLGTWIPGAVAALLLGMVIGAPKE